MASLWILAAMLFAHGTAVIVLSAPDGFVIAGDGLTILNGQRLNANPKVAVCGKRFLCGMGGFNPIASTVHGHKIEYEFNDWIKAIPANPHGSVRQFADAVQREARVTFREMNFFLKEDEFWKAQRGGLDFMRYVIVGYSDEVPQLCTVALKINWNDRTLEYPPVTCNSPLPATGHFDILPVDGTQYQHIHQAMKIGTAEWLARQNIIAAILADVVAVFPDAPLELQKIAAIGAAGIQVEGKFNPKLVGGNSTVGIVAKDKTPAIAQIAARY